MGLNDDGDDHFIDEDDIEIVSLLDRHGGNERKLQNDDKVISVNDSNSNKKVPDNKGDPSPRAQLFGVCATIGLFLLVATLLLSKSSTLPDIQINTASSNHDNSGGSNNNNKNDNSNESSSHLIPSFSPSQQTRPSKTNITTQTEKSDTKNYSNNNETEAINSQIPVNESVSEGDDEIEWFQLQTGNSRIDRAYRLAMEELKQNIEQGTDGSPYFVTGPGGHQSSTRTTAYAIELGAGLVHPDVSKSSLESCTEMITFSTEKGEFDSIAWYQETSDDFGGWPALSDAIVGARGAWHLYLYTGNSTFLEWAYETTLRSLVRAELQALEGSLFGGAASFMESNSAYPKKYNNEGELVGKTKALSTNILYYCGYHYAYKMGTILMENNQIVNSLKDRSKQLKNTIRKRLWMEDKGSYGFFEDEDGKLVEKTEGLGVALAMLSEDFESDHRIRMLFKSLHRTEMGIPSLWPPYDEKKDGDVNDKDDLISEHYHNGRLWPFLSGLFAIAAAKHGHSEIFAEEMANLITLSEQGNTFAEFYEVDKSFVRNRRQQLWSDTGYLGMVLKGLFGMDFQRGAIEFSPKKVDGTDGVLRTNETISLLNVKYRNAILDIYVTGFGTNVTSFKLNGKVQKSAKLDGWVTGRQLIEIEIAPSTT